MKKNKTNKTIEEPTAKTASGKKAKVSKSTWITLGVAAAVAVACGIPLGFKLHAMLLADEVDDSNLNANLYNVDYDALLKRYQSAVRSKASFKDTFAAYDLANISIGLFMQNEHSMAQAIGQAIPTSIAMVQEVRSTKIRSGDSYFEESNSQSSVVALADRAYQSGETTAFYRGSIGSSVEEGVYNAGDLVSYSNDDYKTFMGHYVSSPVIFQICKATTILDDSGASGIPTSVTQKSDGGYTVELELDKVAAVINYKTQMVSISNLATRPTFYFCHLTFQLDSSLNPISYNAYEKYYAKTKAGVGSQIVSNLNTTFSSGGNYAIPDLNIPLTYGGKTT